jgi:hypothetical protein
MTKPKTRKATAADHLAALEASDSRRRKGPPKAAEQPAARHTLTSIAVPPELLARIRLLVAHRSNAEGRRVPPYELVAEALDLLEASR